MSVRATLVALAATLVAAGCTLQEAPHADSVAAVAAAQKAIRTFNPDTYKPPAVDSTPDDPFEAAAYRGLAILTKTRDSLPDYAGNSLNCTSCHLDEGRRANAAPLVGVTARYPRYVDRVDAVVSIEDRVNYCFTRSLAGTKIPNDSREMADIVAYLTVISRGVPVGEHVRGEGIKALAKDVPRDSARGHLLFRDNCARCHGTNGQGIGVVPALWGARSYSIGASMARVERAAAFIRYNMPFDRPGTLTDQQAFDIAAYINSMSRPDLPGKENDWPQGGAPEDTPYETKGHLAGWAPRVIPRTSNLAGAIVPAPSSVVNRRR